MSDLLQRAALVLVGITLIVIGAWNLQSKEQKQKEKQAAKTVAEVAVVK